MAKYDVAYLAYNVLRKRTMEERIVKTIGKSSHQRDVYHVT